MSSYPQMSIVKTGLGSIPTKVLLNVELGGFIMQLTSQSMRAFIHAVMHVSFSLSSLIRLLGRIHPLFMTSGLPLVRACLQVSGIMYCGYRPCGPVQGRWLLTFFSLIAVPPNPSCVMHPIRLSYGP